MSRRSREQRYREAQRQHSYEAKRAKAAEDAEPPAASMPQAFADSKFSFSWAGVSLNDLEIDRSGELMKRAAKDIAYRFTADLVRFAEPPKGFFLDGVKTTLDAYGDPGKPINGDVSLWPFSFQIERIIDRGADIEIRTYVLERGLGDKMALTFLIGIDAQLTGAARTAKIREIVLRAMAHELDECLRHPDGRRVTEPHNEWGAPFFPVLMRAEEVPPDAPERRGFIHETTGNYRGR